MSCLFVLHRHPLFSESSNMTTHRTKEVEIIPASVGPLRRESGTVAVCSQGHEHRSAELLRVALGQLRKNTVAAYGQDVRRFGDWWEDASGGKVPSACALSYLLALSAGEARQTVLSYQSELMSQGLAQGTIARSMRSLNSIVKKLNFAELVPWVLCIPVAKIVPYKDVRGPGRAAWDALLQNTEDDRRWHGPRDLAMFRLLGNDGFRASEVGKILFPDHVRDSVEHGPEIFVQGKGGKDLWQPVHPKTWAAIQSWLLVRAEVVGVVDSKISILSWKGLHGPLFFSDRGNAISGKRLWARVAVRAKDAGLSHIHPHQLRHHAITVRAKAWTGSQAALTAWARHEDPRTTKLYVDDVSGETRKIADLGD